MNVQPLAGAVSRRRLFRTAAAASGALLAAPALTGCAGGNLLAAATVVGRPADLTVYLLGGTGAGGGAGPGGRGGFFGGFNFATPSLSLTDFDQPLRGVINQARQAASGVGTVTFQSGSSDASSWFPLPSTLYNVGNQQANRADDPSIPMPDVVICLHPQMDDYLANRALDLAPYIKDAASAVQGIPAAVLRAGMAYAATRGTIQASVPVLRNPPVCLIPSTVSATPGNKLWTSEQFDAALAQLAASFVEPNAPMLFLPAPLLAPGAILGSGGLVAQSTGTSSTAAFADGGALQGVSTLVGWGQYCSNAAFFRGGATPQYGLWVGDGRTAFIAGGKPPAIGFGRTRPAAPVAPLPGATWQIAPLPSFPSRPAVPITNNIDVMVFLHTKSPAAAASFALQLVSEAVQANLLPSRSGLALRPAQAQRQLTAVIGPSQGATFLADGTNDVIPVDWMGGPETDGNTQAWQTIQSDLTGAFDVLMGARDGDFNFGSGGPSYPTVPSASQIQTTLQQAQAAANQGQPFSPTTA